MGLTATMAAAYAAASTVVLATVILLFAALHDIAFRTVPNWVPLLLLFVGTLTQLAHGTLMLGLLAGLLVFLGSAFCWRQGWLGGGDVKLLAACAVLVPPPLAIELLLDVAIAGGMLALLYLVGGRLMPPPPIAARPSGLLQRIYRAERHRICRRGPLPYASAIAAGALLVLLKD